jgi:hypothetical protein
MRLQVAVTHNKKPLQLNWRGFLLFHKAVETGPAKLLFLECCLEKQTLRQTIGVTSAAVGHHNYGILPPLIFPMSMVAGANSQRAVPWGLNFFWQ